MSSVETEAQNRDGLCPGLYTVAAAKQRLEHRIPSPQPGVLGAYACLPSADQEHLSPALPSTRSVTSAHFWESLTAGCLSGDEEIPVLREYYQVPRYSGWPPHPRFYSNRRALLGSEDSPLYTQGSKLRKWGGSHLQNVGRSWKGGAPWTKAGKDGCLILSFRDVPLTGYPGRWFSLGHKLQTGIPPSLEYYFVIVKKKKSFF